MQVVDGSCLRAIWSRERSPGRQVSSGQWVLLDPVRARPSCPKNMNEPTESTFPAAEALRAVLHRRVDQACAGGGRRPAGADDPGPAVAPPAEPIPDGFVGHAASVPGATAISWLCTLGRHRPRRLPGRRHGARQDGAAASRTCSVAALERGRPAPHRLPDIGTWQLGERELRTGSRPPCAMLRYHGLESRRAGSSPTSTWCVTTYGLVSPRHRASLGSRPVGRRSPSTRHRPSRTPTAQRAKRGPGCCQRSHRVALSGTPVENQAGRAVVAHGVPRSPACSDAVARFHRHRGGARSRSFGDEDLAHRLKLGISPFLLRRLKTDPSG